MTRIELPVEKKVKHLTLLRQPRTISSREFNSLCADERLKIVRAADSGQRYRLLIEAVDGPELMARLPEQDLFLMFKEIGEDEVADLMPMITPDQYTACLDLDCWESDCFKSETALVWLERLLECDPGTVVTTIRNMNFELLILILKKHLKIIQGMETIHDADNQVTAMDRIGGYEVEFPAERESKLFTDLFNILFQYDAPFYIYLMEATRGELDSVIEESVYLQRSDRMLDLGLPDPDSARSIYAWLNPETFTPEKVKLAMTKGDDAIAPPAFMLAVAQPKNLLAAALEEGLSDTGCWELAYLSNKVLISNQVDVGNRDEMRDSLEEMFARLNIALEYLCGVDVEKAVELLDHAYFEHLFRIGYSLTLKLQRRARLQQDAATAPYLDAPDRAFLQGLLHKPHPLLFEGLEHPGIEDVRNFMNLHDLHLASDRLDQLDLLRVLFTTRLPFSLPEPDMDMVGCIPAATGDLDLSTLFLTALANRVLDRAFTPEPIPAADLLLLLNRISSNQKLVPRFRDETVAWMADLLKNTEHFTNSALDLWENDFCPIDPAAIDPRYLKGLIIRL